MAALNASDRDLVRQRIARDLSSTFESIGVTIADLLAAVEATDAWVDANAAAYNAALPQPARSVLTAKQKARLIAAVVLRRWEVS